MKYGLILLLSAMTYSINCDAQNLTIRGKIKCRNQSQNSSKGAENVVIVPAFIPAKSNITSSSPSGYFEFDTGLPLSKLQDKQLTLHVISRCTNCKEATIRKFISEDQDRQININGKHYMTIKDWMLKTNCQQAELAPLAADSILKLVVKQPAQDLNKMSAFSALSGTPALLNFLVSTTTVVGAIGFPTGRFEAASLTKGKIHYGEFLFASAMTHTGSAGFNFCPSRDMSEAVFWNPSAITFSKKSGNISLLTNLKNNGKLTAFGKLSNKFSLGGGIIFTLQDEYRKTLFTQGWNKRYEDSVKMNLMEYGAFISPAFRISKSISLGASLKYIGQDFSFPSYAVVGNNGRWVITDSNAKVKFFDVDLSATFKVFAKEKNNFQIGVNIMNLRNNYLYKDAFIAAQTTRTIQRQRAMGVGLLYKWQRLNIGLDMLATENGLYDASLGLNYVPFNNALISAGFAMKQLSYSLSFRLKHFRVAYINDNQWMINEKRVGKSGILHGKIYSGFIIDLN